MTKITALALRRSSFVLRLVLRHYMTYTPALLEDIRRTADLCVKCNICTSTCPVVPVTDLFPGRNTSARRRSDSAIPGSPSPDHSLDYCSGCGVCTLVCPHSVKVMEINTAAKAEFRAPRFPRESAQPEVVA